MSTANLNTKLIEWQSPGVTAPNGIIGMLSEPNHHMDNIILQDRNGPCFIISLINLLILRGGILEDVYKAKYAHHLDEGWTTVEGKKSNSLSLNVASSSKQAEVQDEEYYTGKKIKLQIDSIQNLKELLSSKSISYAHLINELIYTILMLSEGSSQGARGSQVSDILQDLNQIEKGLNVNLNFNDCHIDDFEEKTESINQLMKIFDIDIVHGFLLIDDFLKHSKEYATFDKSQEYLVKVIDKYQASDNINLEELSPDELAELKESKHDSELDQYIKLSSFLDENKTQLTQKGLDVLTTDSDLFPNNTFKLFFRNDHFNTLYKTDDTLYLLINDEGYSKNKSIVWQSLKSLNGNGDEYLTGFFDLPSRSISKKKKSDDHLPQDPITVGGTIDYSDFNVGDADDYNPEDNPFAADESDEMLAKQLQQQEDEQLAKNLQKRYNSTNSAAGRNDKSKRKNSKSKDVANGLENKGSKKDDKCIIM